MPANLENSAVPKGLEKVSFHSNPKKGNAKECSNYRTIALISHASKVMLKILQARLQQYVNCEFPDVQVGFRKSRGTRDQIANIHWIIEKARVSEEHLLLLHWLHQSLWLCGSWQTVENSSRAGNPRPPATCLLRNLHAGQEATVRTGHGTPDCFQIGKGVCQGCILAPWLFNLSAEYIMRNPRLDEAQGQIKIAGRNINKFRYADDTTLMAESEEGLKSFLMKDRGEWKCWLKIQHSKKKGHGIWSHHFMANRWGNNGLSNRFYFLGLQNHCR